MQSESRESLMKPNFKAILVLIFAVIIISLILLRNIFFFVKCWNNYAYLFH